MDYKSLSNEELIAALAETTEKAKALFALESPTIEQADEADALAAAKLAIETVQAERAAAVKAAEDKFAAAKAAFASEEDAADDAEEDAAEEGDDDDDADSEDNTDDAAEDAEEDAADGDDSEDSADDAEALTAAADAKHTKAQSIRNVKAASKVSTAKAVAKGNKRPAVKSKDPVVITAAADVPGFATGSTLSGMDQVTKAAMGRVKAFQPFNQRAADMVRSKNGGVPELHKFGVAQFGVDFDSSMLAPSNPSPLSEMAAVKAALAEDRFTGTAAGWCAPSENVYSFIADYVVDGLVSVPEVGVTRGGLNITTGPRVGGESQGANLDDFGFLQTEAQAEAQEVKPCEVIECPDFIDWRLDAIGYCFKIPFLTQKAYPELITDALRFANVLYAHKVNRYVINKMVGMATGVNAAPYGASFTDTLEALTIIAVKERRKWNLGVNATMEVKLPVSAREIFRADMSRRNGLALSDTASDARIDAEFSSRKLAVEYVSDWQELTGADAFWPGSFDALIYPAGTFIKGVEDVVNLSAVYDAASLSINEYTGVFFEQGILVGHAGYGASLVNIPVCTAGTTGAAAFLCEGGSF